ncbi:MAG TPA: hypothetical protein VGQ91_12690, partial [Ideonella sp.]|nr:hypothetical protein [Ideonella sp.]
MNHQHSRAQHALRRQFVFGGSALLAASLVPLPAAALSRFDARGRYRLVADFAAPFDGVVLVPFNLTAFQSGSDFALQPDGRVLINTGGLYEISLSIDWDLKAGRDIALRQTGIRRQRPGQPDFPLDAHERVFSGDLPGSNPPEPARFQAPWSPPDIALGAIVTTDVTVEPAGIVKPGDMALASHTQIKDGAMPPEALAALVVQAKVVGVDTVRVSLYNPAVAAGIHIPSGTLNVVALSALKVNGGSGDGWHPLHSPSVVLEAGD